MEIDLTEEQMEKVEILKTLKMWVNALYYNEMRKEKYFYEF